MQMRPICKNLSLIWIAKQVNKYFQWLPSVETTDMTKIEFPAALANAKDQIGFL